MSRERFGIEKGLDIYAENGDTPAASILTTTSAPTGTGDQGTAAISSILLRSDGSFYQKTANAGAPSDWELNGSSAAVVGVWRPEVVSIVTNDTQGAGVRDVVASPFADDDGTDLVPADFIVGEYVIVDADGTPALLEITAKGGTGDKDITFAAAGTALAADDTFITRFYLPDPDGGENKAIVNYNGSVIVKLADIDWQFLTGVNLSGGYTPGTGNPVAGDTGEAAIQKIDGNVDQITAAVGVAQGAGDMGTYTGTLLTDNQTAKQNLQQLETETEALRSSLGGSANATDMGTYTGTTITDNVNQRQVNQELETALEAIQTDVGPANIAQTTPTTVDFVLVDDCQRVEWELTAHDIATPANVQSMKVTAFHNGSSAADATAVLDSLSSKSKLGSNFNLDVSVTLTGAAGAQAMNLVLETSEAGGIRYTTKRVNCVKAL